MLTLVAAAMCIFVVQLDFLSLNLALPQMASDFGRTVTDLQWVVSCYMIAVAATLIPGGRLGDILGRRTVIIAGLAIFGIASLGSGLAPNPEVVIAFRVVQGCGAGILFPLAIAIITTAYPPERAKRAIGNAYGIGALGLAIGPIFGGAVTELLDWRVVLLVNVPTCAVAIAVVLLGVRETRDTTVPRSIDLPGLMTVALGIAVITYAVDRAAAWSGAVTGVVFAVGIVLLIAFVLRERVARVPLVRLSLFRNRAYVAVTLMGTVANIALVVSIFISTIYLQRVEEYSPLVAGVIFLALSVPMGAAGPLSGWLGEHYDIPRTIAIATATGAVGLWCISFGRIGLYIVGLALVGVGYGMGWTMASVGTQTVVAPERVGEASGVTLAIVVGLAGLAVTIAATLVEAGAAEANLAASIENVARWIAVATAIVAALIGALASRLIQPHRSPATTASGDHQ